MTERRLQEQVRKPEQKQDRDQSADPASPHADARADGQGVALGADRISETGTNGRAARRAARAAKQRPRIGLRLCLFLLCLVLAVAITGVALLGRSMPLPVWAVAQIEDRLNRSLGANHLPQGTSLSLGGVQLGLDSQFGLRLLVEDLRLSEKDGKDLLSLPDIRVDLRSAPLLLGQIRPRAVQLTGARISIARDAEGRLALNFAGLNGGPQLGSPAEVLDALDKMFSSPSLADLGLIEVQGLALSLRDLRVGKTWEFGDGRLLIDNRPDALAAEVSLTLLDRETPAQARLLIETAKADSSARLTATVDQIAAQDLAVQAPPLAVLSMIDAPISGQIAVALDASGQLANFSGKLSLGAGALDVTAATAAVKRPLSFDKSALALRYDPQRQRVFIDDLTVESASLRLKASGTSDLMGAAGGPVLPGELPVALVNQLNIGELMVDPEGLFEAPVRFTDGAAGWRVWLDPFRVEIGDITLSEGDEHVSVKGWAGIRGGEGWQGSFDVALNQISTERLIKLWPLSAVPKTREWLAENVGQGELTDVAAALRFKSGEEPRFALDYEFSGAEVRVIKSLPPVKNGHGRAGIQNNEYSLVIEGGEITAPQSGPEGDRIKVDGTLFRVPDITQKPAMAEVRLIVDAGLTATLSLLDQAPFHFISKAGREVNLGQGRALLLADLRFPLRKKLQKDEVEYNVTGRVLDFRSDLLVPGKVITSPDLAVKVTGKGMTVSGAGAFEGLPVVARFEQAFGPENAGKSTVRGTAQLSDARLRKLGVKLPEGWFGGETEAAVELRFAKGKPAELSLTSDVKTAKLALPMLGWSKPAGTPGRLSLEALLGATPEVTKLALTAPGLTAEGRLTTLAGGGLALARFTTLKLGDWLNASAEVAGKGPGQAVGLKLTGGTLDLRKRPNGSGTGGGQGDGAMIEVALDRLVVAEGITLTGLSGNFLMKQGGLEGRFVAGVNSIGKISGSTIAYKGGTAVRITSNDAGRIIAATGIFGQGRGGSLDMTLQPRDVPGQYSGVAKVKDFSVENAPTLAALLSAASIIGLLEQLNGNGIQFSEGDVSFLIVPEGVQIVQGAAIGASMGISFAGLYRSASKQIDIQGTISPIYLLNGIGAILTRKGEGLFGFNYSLYGSTKSPTVSVNPLSILTPGMFRDIFRRAPPVLKGAG